MNINIESIAKTAHEANKAYCEAIGDTSQQHWDEAEIWQRESAISGVKARMENPEMPESWQHDAWMQDKIADGWTYGEVKDAEIKTHPCLVPYEELPEHEKAKDALFVSVVKALIPLIN